MENENQVKVTNSESTVATVIQAGQKNVLCDMCGHINPPDTGICEMCSNYLFDKQGR